MNTDIEHELRHLGNVMLRTSAPITADEIAHARTPATPSPVELVNGVPLKRGRRRHQTPQPRPHRPWLAAAVVAIVVAGIAAVWAVARNDTATPPVPADQPTAPVSTASSSDSSESDGDLGGPASEDFASELPAPVSGETQRTVIGDITWTLVEGDGSTQPERVSALIDSEFFGVDEDGQTWRSADGISWQPTDPILDSGLAVVEIAGESWGRRFSPDGSQLVRWDGDKFEAVELPDSSTPLSDGLQRSGPLLGTPLGVGDEVVVPAHTRLEVPWSDLYSARVIPEWDAATETIRLRDAASSDQLPVAVVSAEWTGDARALEFRDVETGEVVTTVEPVPGIAADEFFTRIIGGGITYNEFFIGDESGFEVVSAPWSLADAPRVAALDGRLIAVVEYQRVESPGAGVQEWELWISADARTWEPLELPTPSRPRIDEINIVSDGALALLTIVSSGESVQRPETWSTRDGQTWAPVERAAGFGGIEITDVGWVQINVGESEGVSVSSDGLTWQNIVVSLLPPAGPGNGDGSVHGDTIFLTMNENGGPRTMWVGQVDDN